MIKQLKVMFLEPQTANLHTAQRNQFVIAMSMAILAVVIFAAHLYGYAG